MTDSCIGQHINDDATSLTAIIATTAPSMNHHHPIRSNVPTTSTTTTTTTTATTTTTTASSIKGPAYHDSCNSIEYSVPIISVVAVTPTWGIGNKGTLPWHPLNKSLPRDLGR
jgi:hypothetical protein